MKISADMHARLRKMARAEGRTMRALLESALEDYRQSRFLERLDAAYSKLRSDPKVWAEVVAEREVWDRTLGDGLSRELPAGPRPRGSKKKRRRK